MKRYFRVAGLMILVTMVTTLTANIAVADNVFVLPLVSASSSTPFSANCNGFPQTGTNYPNAEVEPWVSINPRNQANLIGVWQQDRWSNGGANGLLTGVSFDGGRNWRRPVPPAFTACAGGTAANGGDYERASDPWVSFSPNGTAHQISLSFNNDKDFTNGVLVSRSTNSGLSWSKTTTLIRDTDPDVFNDKESITADPNDSRYVYAVWDRLTGLTLDPTDPHSTGPTWLSRSTDGGQTWKPAKIIYDPGFDSQTIGNQIVVLPNGTLVDVFTEFLNFNGVFGTPSAFVGVVRSDDHGQTWSKPTIISTQESVGITDPDTGYPVRTGDIIPSIAVDPESGALYVVTQDSRFSNGQRDGIIIFKSLNGGKSWSNPIQVNKATRTQAFTAAINVGDDGVIGVTYYDFRNFKPGSATLDTDYWLANSTDGGRTWKETRIGKSFDMRTAPDAGGYFTGDYEGLTHNSRGFLPFFVAANTGKINNRTDVFSTLALVGDDDRSQGSGFEDNHNSRQSLKQKAESHRARSRK